MPRLPNKPCRRRGCKEYQERQGFCSEHYLEQERGYGKQRGTKKERGYGEVWKKVRSRKFKRNPLCERCEANGVVRQTDIVHHRDNNSRNNHMDNLESLCIQCHNREHQGERWG